jgi:hypothetical protein
MISKRFRQRLAIDRVLWWPPAGPGNRLNRKMPRYRAFCKGDLYDGGGCVGLNPAG